MWFLLSGTECLSRPPLAALCPSGRYVPPSGWAPPPVGWRRNGILVPGWEERGTWAGLGGTGGGGGGGGVEPGEEVAEQWAPSVQRALRYMWVGPPEVSQ